MPFLCFITSTSIKATLRRSHTILSSPPGYSKLGLEINTCEMGHICLSLKGRCGSGRGRGSK